MLIRIRSVDLDVARVISLRKTIGKVSPILFTLTSSRILISNVRILANISLKESIPDGVDPNSDGHDYCVRKNEGKIRWFSADCHIENL